jgi:outer membrane murein-binding lipoprotein Lpp
MFYRLKFRAMASLLKNKVDVAGEQKAESANSTKNLESLSKEVHALYAKVDSIAGDVTALKASQAASVAE